MLDVIVRAHRLEHVERHQRERASMVRTWGGNARGDHVAVPDRLDLLEPVPLRECVEVAEQAIEVADHLDGREPLRPGREVDDVGE
jgi:hypothetical protein